MPSAKIIIALVVAVAIIAGLWWYSKSGSSTPPSTGGGSGSGGSGSGGSGSGGNAPGPSPSPPNPGPNPSPGPGPSPTYQLVTVMSSSCSGYGIQVSPGNMASLTNSPSSISEFYQIPSPNNSERFQLQERVSGYLLGATSIGDNVGMYLYSSGTSGLFSWWSVSGSQITLNPDNGNATSGNGNYKVMNVAGGSCSSSTNVHLYSANSGNTANSFQIVKVQ